MLMKNVFKKHFFGNHQNKIPECRFIILLIERPVLKTNQKVYWVTKNQKMKNTKKESDRFVLQ